MSGFYDREGRPITLERFIALRSADPGYKRVAADDIDEDIWVSTVWLGIDHDFTGRGPPVIFETMIFGGPYDGEQWRYCTEGEAFGGHVRIVIDLLAGRDPVGCDECQP